MAKSRIIIADPEVTYIMPLQIQFIKKFFEEVELELITEWSYFDEMFSKAQRVDILIVSEEWYEASLHRHSIGNIFVLAENYRPGETEQLSVTRIYKYTSVNDIFNEIIGRSGSSIHTDKSNKKDTEVVVVTSASGGVGKTTIAMGISAILAQNYKKVLYVNASQLQSFQHVLENKVPITTSDIYEHLSNPTDQVYRNIKHCIRQEKFSYLPEFKASLLSLGIENTVFQKIVESARESKDYDYIVVDAECAFDAGKIALLNIADKVVVITTQDNGAVNATNKFVQNINMGDSNRYIFLCNQFNKDEMNALKDNTGKFAVSEYLEKMNELEKIDMDELARNKALRKMSLLIID